MGRFTALRLLLLPLVILLLLWPAPAAAHPLGQFTTNQYTRIELESETIRLRYIVDLAEIPTFQELLILDQNGDRQIDDAEQAVYLERQVPALVAGLVLLVDGAPLDLTVTGHTISFPPGEGGLPTLRLELDLQAPLTDTDGPLTIEYRSENYAERLGWREIVVQAQTGWEVAEAGLPLQDVSDELRAYPDELLATPLDVRSVAFTATPGAAASSGGPAPASAPAESRVPDPLAALVVTETLTLPVMLGALALAFVLGAGHALTPGHGKTVVAAYLVGARGTAKHAIFLGLTTTITHTSGVFLLGILTLSLSQTVVSERLYPWLELISGVLIVVIGGSLLRNRFMRLVRRRQSHTHTHHDHAHGHVHHHDYAHDHAHHHHHDHAHDHAHHHHDHDHDHDHGPHGHSHMPPGADGQPVTWRSLLALGISGGLLPCPSALVVLLGAIALNRLAFGMVLIVAFSLGLAAVLTGIGLLLVYAHRLFERMPVDGPLLRILPVASALVVTLVGALLTLGAVSRVL